MATFKRKQYVIDKKFQYNVSFKAVALPLITVLIVGFVLLFFAVKNNNYINSIVKTQGDMIEMFLTTPALVNSNNPTIKNAKSTFDNNIGMLQEIKRNSGIVMYFIIAMIVVQSIIIFAIFIFLTHRISGPIWVMTNYLKAIQQGKKPSDRPLRKNDEFKNFYAELQATVEKLMAKNKKK
jgi:nitrogen fixation/metabolism regulation signal transduction histidine kinase